MAETPEGGRPPITNSDISTQIINPKGLVAGAILLVATAVGHVNCFGDSDIATYIVPTSGQGGNGGTAGQGGNPDGGNGGKGGEVVGGGGQGGSGGSGGPEGGNGGTGGGQGGQGGAGCEGGGNTIAVNVEDSIGNQNIAVVDNNGVGTIKGCTGYLNPQNIDLGTCTDARAGLQNEEIGTWTFTWDDTNYRLLFEKECTTNQCTDDSQITSDAEGHTFSGSTPLNTSPATVQTTGMSCSGQVMGYVKVEKK